MKTLTWWIFNIAFTSLMVAGWCYDIAGARNVVAAVVVVFVLFGLLGLGKTAIAEKQRLNHRPTPKRTTTLFVLRFCFFAWFGAFWICSGLSLILLLGSMADGMAFPAEEGA